MWHLHAIQKMPFATQANLATQSHLPVSTPPLMSHHTALPYAGPWALTHIVTSAHISPPSLLKPSAKAPHPAAGQTKRQQSRSHSSGLLPLFLH